jgi:hypothetical protein
VRSITTKPFQISKRGNAKERKEVVLQEKKKMNKCIGETKFNDKGG